MKESSVLRALRAAGIALMLLCVFPFSGIAEAVSPDPSSVTYVDLGERKMKLEEVEAVLDQYPNLEQADMFATPVNEGQILELEARYPGVTFGWTLRIGFMRIG